MTGYSVAREGSVFGMDVHARSVTVRGFDWAAGEQRSRRFCGPEPAGEIAAWMGECFTAPHAAAYESGCTGFHLCWRLREVGVRCAHRPPQGSPSALARRGRSRCGLAAGERLL